MADSPDLTPAKRQQHAERKKRLARALRENLHRRKRQARAKQEDAAGRAADRAADDPPA